MLSTIISTLCVTSVLIGIMWAHSFIKYLCSRKKDAYKDHVSL